VQVFVTRERLRSLRYLRKADSVRNETFCMQHVELGSISSISFHKQTISLYDPIQTLQCLFVNFLSLT